MTCVGRACARLHPCFLLSAGMIAEVYVVSPGDKVFTAGSLRASARTALLLAVTAATAMFVP